MAQITIFPGTPQARQVALREGVNRIGRADGNDITIADGSVSSSHCEVTLASGSVRIRDLGSTNGTFINGAPVTETTLQPGQRIQLGSAQLLFDAPTDRIDVTPVALEAMASVTAPVAAPSLSSMGGVSHGTALSVGGIAQQERPQAIALSPAGGEGRAEGISPPAPAKPVVRLRVARPAEEARAEAPVVAVETELLAGAPPPSAPNFNVPANAHCKYHPRSPARWVCTGCHKTYCDLCVTARSGQHFCRSCAATCAPLDVVIEVPKERGFFSELPRAVIYPFRGTGILVLIVATLIFAGLDVMSGGMRFLVLGKIIALGYLFAYVQSIIHSTAAGDDKLPELPAMDGLFGHCFRLVGTILMSFGFALIAAYFVIFQEQPGAIGFLIGAIIFGCLYFPMAFLAVAIKDTVLASNPLVVVPSIVRVPVEYIVATILVAGVFAIRWAGDAITGTMGSKAMMTESMSEMFLLFGLRIIWAFLSVYLLTVTMRILGLLYLTKRDRLGW